MSILVFMTYTSAYKLVGWCPAILHCMNVLNTFNNTYNNNKYSSGIAWFIFITIIFFLPSRELSPFCCTNSFPQHVHHPHLLPLHATNAAKVGQSIHMAPAHYLYFSSSPCNCINLLMYFYCHPVEIKWLSTSTQIIVVLGCFPTNSMEILVEQVQNKKRRGDVVFKVLVFQYLDWRTIQAFKP